MDGEDIALDRSGQANVGGKVPLLSVYVGGPPLCILKVESGIRLGGILLVCCIPTCTLATADGANMRSVTRGSQSCDGTFCEMLLEDWFTNSTKN